MAEESVFLAALDRTDPGERQKFLDEACAGDPELRRRIDVLLAAYAAGKDRLEPPANETIAFVPSAAVGTIIAGRYKLLEAIGEGGMGEVWVAEQTEPVKRKVALKLIKAGMDSKSVLARFEAERQALAVMDHPNIAKVLDGGLTDAGRPFFVMEYVKGVPITEYCDATRLSVPERLNLFVQVCSAVQHAHQKGIIHRDLKPSNILVAPYDDKPVPKVIDFGLAKAMHQSLTEKTLHTAHETVLGTPLYMSPEQAQLNNLDVDTRSDIYSLGVLLYELLTGTTPLEKKRFKEAAWDEIKRIIREEEAPRPSTRLSSSNTLASLAAGRQIEPARLTKLVRGELDWIVMKSLEKDRTRRYETANGFAADINRYLAGEPVVAHPPSARYRLKKFVRRHKTAMLTSGALVFALAACTIVSLIHATRATIAEHDAIRAAIAERQAKEREAAQRAIAQNKEREALKAEGEAKEQRDKARDAEKRAQTEKTNATAALDYISEGILSSGSPDSGVDPDIKLRTIVDLIAEDLEKGKKQPLLVEASIRHTLGKIYVFERFAEARAHFQRAYDIRKEVLSKQHPDTIRTMIYLGHPDLWREEQIARKETEETLGERYAVEAWKLAKDVLGPNDLSTLIAMRHVARYHNWAKRFENAEQLHHQFLKDCVHTREESDTWSITALIDLAWHYLVQRKFEKAEEYAKRAIKLRLDKQGPDHYLTYLAIETLANVYGRAGRYVDAEPLWRRLIDGFYRHVGDRSPSYLSARSGLAFALNRQGKHKEAAKEYHEAIPQLKQAPAFNRWQLGFDLTGQGDSLNKLQRFAEAEPVLREALTIRKAVEGFTNRAFNTQSILGETLIGLKRFQEAESYLQEAYRGQSMPFASDEEFLRPEFLQATLERLVKLYDAWDKPDEAAKWRKELPRIESGPLPREVR